MTDPIPRYWYTRYILIEGFVMHILFHKLIYIRISTSIIYVCIHPPVVSKSHVFISQCEELYLLGKGGPSQFYKKQIMTRNEIFIHKMSFQETNSKMYIIISMDLAPLKQHRFETKYKL